MRLNRSYTRLLVVGAVSLHVLALCLYVLPIAPGGLRVLATAYVRPLFHQQWKLFAPDPPLCSCEIQISFHPGAWRSLHQEGDHYLEQRMVQHIARHFQVAVHAGDTEFHPYLKKALKEASSPHGDPAQAMFRLIEQCVIDPFAPADRELRITPIEL